MERRKFLELSSIASLFILTGCGGGSTNNGMGAGMGDGMDGDSGDSGSSLPSANKNLPIPPAVRGTNFNLNIQQSQHEFFAGMSTSTYAVNGSYLGPTLIVRNGTGISINYTNSLNERVSMHGHGMHLPANMDGSTHQEMAPGGAWSARYTVNQTACTNWYHPHTLHRTGAQTYKGLGGLIIIEDAQSDALNLPKRYGEDDIPLVLQDRKFDGNGQFVYAPNMRAIPFGYVGETFIANGAIEPTFDAEAKEIRFRILNGSNSSVYELGFSDGRSFKQIATDNSFLESPVSMNRLTLTPAERAEIVVDLSNDLGASLSLQEFRHGKTFVHINVSKNAITTTKVPSRLTNLVKLNPADATNTRIFNLEGKMGEGLVINGKSMDPSRIDENVPVNNIEIWEINNKMPIDHNFHIHGTHFRLLERNGNSNIPANERGYKDTIYVPGRQSVKVIVKMTDYVDANVPYMYHCHFLEHEDNGMMGQFIVT
jgi:FtsP/CotA-like multicopper oxidase with cupredoxin domain